MISPLAAFILILVFAGLDIGVYRLITDLKEE